VAVMSLTATPAWAADTYALDLSHSSFIFRVKHLGVSYSYGRFNDASGSFTIDEADPSKNAIEIEIKTASVDTYNEGRDKHLRNPDFFNSTEFPTMTFKSTAFKKKEGNLYEVTGDFTLLGVTKSITAEAELVGVGKGMKGEQRAGWDAVFTIDRTDFGMNYGQEGIGKEVRIIVGIEGIKK
ncbi:MAG TPA: YceI family protein, partial [Candidatus Hydrogenedentes bacterium]|nr:YceI family protein [Candidatus Hydrogenedentota bacterium]